MPTYSVLSGWIGKKVFFRFTTLERKEIFSLELPTASSASLESLITQCLTEFRKKYSKNFYTLKTACFGIAGPVTLDGTVKMTNISSWPKITLETLSIACGIPESCISVINDFEAIGYGIEVLTRTDKNGESFIPLYLPEPLKGTKNIVAKKF